jgi:predicted nucleic acid-binding protein
MQVDLTAHSEELLRNALAHRPDQSPAQIIERALDEQVQRETPATSARPRLTKEEFHAWLDQFTLYSDSIPAMPGETFSREMIYQDHN